MEEKMGNASLKMEAGVTSAEVSSLGRPAGTSTPTTAASTAPSPLRRMHHYYYYYYYYSFYYQVHSQLYINTSL